MGTRKKTRWIDPERDAPGSRVFGGGIEVRVNVHRRATVEYRSRYRPHQGDGECERRRRQMAAGTHGY